jgi:serine protease Do
MTPNNPNLAPTTVPTSRRGLQWLTVGLLLTGLAACKDFPVLISQTPPTEATSPANPLNTPDMATNSPAVGTPERGSSPESSPTTTPAPETGSGNGMSSGSSPEGSTTTTPDTSAPDTSAPNISAAPDNSSNSSSMATPTPPAPEMGSGSSFNTNRAKLENERNTIDVRKRSDASIAFISAKSSSSSDPFGQSSGNNSSGSGSGFVIDTSGLILTNNHVVTLESDVVASSLLVKFHNDPKTYNAKVVGRSPVFDIALIQVEATGKQFNPLPLGNSDTIEVGQKAIAMGNPFGQQFSITEGIISATGRTFEGSNLAANVIQTDAAINPGNSGGPLIDSSGQVIGINTAILSPGTGFSGQAQFAGIAFAVPINLVKGLLPDLKAGKVIDRDTLANTRPRLGITSSAINISDYPAEYRRQYNLPESGAMITEVQADSPAARAGLRAASAAKALQTSFGSIPTDGDVITTINGQAIDSSNALGTIIFNAKPGEEMNVTFWRDGKEQQLKIKPEVLPVKR